MCLRGYLSECRCVCVSRRVRPRLFASLYLRLCVCASVEIITACTASLNHPTPRQPHPALLSFALPRPALPVSVNKHSSEEEDTCTYWLRKHQVRGWRAVSAVGRQGKGLRKRSVYFTDAGDATICVVRVVFHTSASWTCVLCLSVFVIYIHTHVYIYIYIYISKYVFMYLFSFTDLCSAQRARMAQPPTTRCRPGPCWRYFARAERSDISNYSKSQSKSKSTM